MNPEQPSREQIEARITALLLGELPAAEAELLRWTISQDPELQKLHDQLKLTIGFVREAMKNPAGAPPERDTPMKLRQERRQMLLAHFKTARPHPQLPEPSQPSQKLSWLRTIEVIKASPLIAALAVIAIIAVLAAISIPNFVKARSTSQENACINNLRQIDAAKNEWALETHKPADAVPTVKDLTPYLQGNEIRPVAGEQYTLGKVSEPTVADFNGKRLTASPENFASAASDQSVASNRRRDNSAELNDSEVTTIAGRQTTRSPGANPGISTVTPAPAPIALPNTESSQTESAENAGTVYSQNVVGHINTNPRGYQEFANQSISGSTASSSAGSSPERQPAPKTEPDFTFSTSSQSAANTASPLESRLQYRLPGTEAQGAAEAQIPPTVAGGVYNVEKPGASRVFISPADSARTEETNFAALNQSPNAFYQSINGQGGKGRDKSAFVTRESPNATTFSDNNGSSQAGPLPSRESRNANPMAENSVNDQPSMPAPVLAPPQLPRESQNANTVVQNSDGLHNGPVGTFDRVPVVGEVPVTGRLFAAPALPPTQQPQPSNIDTLKYQYAEGKKDHIRVAEPIDQSATPIFSSEQVQSLNEKLVEQKAIALKLEKEVDEFQTIQATNPTDRVAGIIYGLQAQAVATQAQIAGVTNQLNDIVAENQDELGRDRPYWIARAQLQNKEDLHRMLGEKIEADEADAQLPKSSLVTIVNPAQRGQSLNLWQRMTGTVESKAQIEIQPDVTTAAPLEYSAYDPYFAETEVNTIQSDAVLGRVVDSLKLGDSKTNSRKDAIAKLRSQLDLASDRNTKLIDIGVKSDKPEEAAKIANAVAETYKEYRLDTHSNEMVAGIGRLKEKYAEEERQIHNFKSDLVQKQAVSPELQSKREAAETPAPALASKGDTWRRPPANAPIPQPEIQTRDNAFSTFSMNVSDVSFKLAMASLQKGQMPDPASIRSEEFINAFDYHDPEPLQGEPLAFVSERAADPFAQERDLLRFSIKAAAAGRQDGRALNLVLLLDTSGSMERSDRVAIIREALRVLSAQLQPQDIVSVVTFARTARLWADGIPGSQAGDTLDKVGSITPEGGTNLEEAMRLAYETALRHFIASGMNRVVMLTDGAANLGNVDPQALTQKVDAERRQGIALDCFGIGWDDYNDDLLEQLSSSGDGRYAFINSPDEATTEFAAKLAGALQVAAEDVKVQVEFNPSRVTAWRQVGYAKHQLTKEQFRDNTVAAGAIAAREAGNALYVIETDPNGEGPIATVHVRYRVPGTQDVHEHSWAVDYTGAAPELAQASPAMRLAVTAAEISEWMADSPFAQNVTPDDLLNYLSGVPQFYGTDDRPKQLETMIQEAKSVSGK